MTAGSPRYPFQIRGADWLSRRDRALLADEMGLGKTVQAIDAADRTGAERVLVVCRAVGRRQWAREFETWSAADRTVQIPAPGDNVDPRVDLTVINYDIIHRPEVLRQLVRQRWDVLVLDEMHSLKAGRGSLRGEVVLDRERGLYRRAGVVWGLSGTPAPNHAGDLHPWLSALHPDLIGPELAGSYERFLQHYTYCEQTPYGWRVRGNRRGRELRRLLHDGGVVLRRRRAEVLPELPDLTVDTLPLPPDSRRAARAVAQLQDHPDADLVRSVLLGMDPDEHPAAAVEAWEQDLSTLRRITGLAKIEPVAQQVADELDGGREKVVVMGWHPEVLDTLAERLAEYRPVVVHGRTDPADKEQAEQLFQSDPERRVFLGNILSAGTTITLTAADRMLIAEPSWVPGENEQAILRILRIGQDRHCHVTFPALEGTVDEIIQSVYARKARMITEFM